MLLAGYYADVRAAEFRCALCCRKHPGNLGHLLAQPRQARPQDVFVRLNVFKRAAQIRGYSMGVGDPLIEARGLIAAEGERLLRPRDLSSE